MIGRCKFEHLFMLMGFCRDALFSVFIINPIYYEVLFENRNILCILHLTAMPARVHNIVGYLPSDNNAIFAIFENSPGYAKGDNFGTSWSMIPTSEYDVVSAKADFVAHKSIPFTAQAGFAEEIAGDFKGKLIVLPIINCDTE